MALAVMLLSMSVYAVLFVLPVFFTHNCLVEGVGGVVNYDMESRIQGLSLLAYTVGLSAFGFVCSYLVQRYRRNKVCSVSILLLALTIFFCPYLWRLQKISPMLFVFSVIALRFIMGACYGLAQMTLLSTLVIDVSCSNNRTFANHYVAWFMRFALSLGPIMGLVILKYFSLNTPFIVLSLCAVAAMFLVLLVRFPFKAPMEMLPHFSVDRYFLTSSKPLCVNLLLAFVAVGMVFKAQSDLWYYAFLMLGFCLSIILERISCCQRFKERETALGQAVMGIAILLLCFAQNGAYAYVSAALLGCGIGLMSVRFLFLFINVSEHCQRGTAQSSYFLSIETGLSLGFMTATFGCLEHCSKVPVVALGIIIISLAMCLGFTLGWYKKHKIR